MSKAELENNKHWHLTSYPLTLSSMEKMRDSLVEATHHEEWGTSDRTMIPHPQEESETEQNTELTASFFKAYSQLSNLLLNSVSLCIHHFPTAP
jgi:hypothetical protein